MKLYMATGTCSLGGTVCIKGSAILARSEDEAVGMMFRSILKEYPKSGDYEGHDVTATVIPDAMVLAAAESIGAANPEGGNS